MFSRKVLESVYRANIARGKVPYAVFPVMAIGGAAAAADNKLTPQQEKVLHEGSAPNKAQYSATAKTDYENHSQGRTDKFRVTPTITGTSNTTSYNQYNPTTPGSSDSTSMTKSNPSSTLTGSQGYTGNQGYTGSYSSLRPENQFSTALAGENLEDRGPDSSLLKRVTQGQTGWSYPKIFDKDFWNRPLDESGRVLGTYVRQVSLDLQRHPLRPEHQFSTALAGENLEDRGPEDSLLKRVTHKVGEYLPHDINMKRDYTEKIYRDYDTDYTKRDYNVRNLAYDKTTQMMDKSKEKIGEMKDKTADTAYNLKEKGKEVASDMMDKSKEKMGEMKEKTADTAYNLKEKGKEVASDVMDKSKEKVGEMKEKTADTAHNLKEKGMEVASEIKEKAYEAKEKMSEKIHEYAPSTQDMKEKFYETKEKAEQVGHNLKDKVAEYIPTSLSSITDTVKSAVVGSENNESKVPGDSERLKTRMGEEAANLLQSHTPINSFKTHTSTIRVFADEPKRQLMTHKYTAHVNEDVMQTLIMDSDKADARLIGIEYCITDKLYKSLPAEEKKLWYSHAFEAKSGIEVAPRLPSSMENKLMEDIAPTWGKSISMWQVDKNLLPVGFPKLLAPPANAQMINKDVWEQREKMFGPISKERQMRLPNVGKEDAWEKKGAIFTPDYKKL